MPTLAQAFEQVNEARLTEVVSPELGKLAEFTQAEWKRLVKRLHGQFPGMSWDDAADVVQTAILELLENRSRFDFSRPVEGLILTRARWRMMELHASRGRSLSIHHLPIELERSIRPLEAVETLDQSRLRSWAKSKRERWDEAGVAAAFQRFYSQHGRAPSQGDSQRLPAGELPSQCAVQRLFGTWTEAVRAAGLIPLNYGRRSKRWTDREVAEALATFKRCNGFWPKWSDYRTEGMPSTAAVARRAGGIKLTAVIPWVEATLAQNVEGGEN